MHLPCTLCVRYFSFQSRCLPQNNLPRTGTECATHSTSNQAGKVDLLAVTSIKYKTSNANPDCGLSFSQYFFHDLQEYLETSPLAFQDTFHILLFSSYLISHSYTASFDGPSPWTLVGRWQDLIVGPLLFNSHFLDVLQSHGFKYHLCTNDSQISISSSDLSSKLQNHISNFLLSISKWMSNRLLKLQLPKIALLFPFKLALPIAFPITTDGPTILPIAQTLDLSLTPLSRTFPHSIHEQVLLVLPPKCILPLLVISTAVTLIQTTIIFHLDYCKSFLVKVSLLLSLPHPPEHLLNIAITVILWKCK